MRSLLKDHPLIVMHLALLGVLSLGLVERTGMRYLHWMALYASAVVMVYALGGRLLPSRSTPGRALLGTDRLVKGVLFVLPLFALVHWWRSGGPPTWQAFVAADELVTSALREAPKHETWRWLNYGSLLLISAVLPFSIALAHGRRHRLLPWLLAASMVYAASLLPKSYVVVIVIPLAVLLIIERKWFRLGALGACCLGLIMALAWLGDPDKVREASAARASNEQPVDEGLRERGLVGDALWHIGRRVFLTPGWTVADWFPHIPADIPWCQGSAVRPLAAITGRPYIDVASRIYELEYPEEVKRGIHGTVPSAAFMYDYANFGGWGLLLSAVLTGGLFALLRQRAGFRGKWAWCFGLYPVLALGASAFTTVLLTHGLLLTVLLFLLTRPDLDAPAP